MHKNRSVITLAILLSVSLLLMVFNVKLEGLKIRNVFFTITYPIEYAVTGVSNFFKNTFAGITRIQELEEELVTTRQRLVDYQEKLLLYEHIIDENEELKELLNIQEEIDYTATYAQIIFRDPTLEGDYFVIDKGSSDGLEVDMPVVSFDTNEVMFLVGRLTEVTPFASKVKLLTSKTFYLGVTLEDSGYVGILNGNGSWNQNCVVDYIPLEATAYAGQGVVTSGESDIFPDDILVGTIVGVAQSLLDEFFYTLYIKPEYNYSTIEHVFILEWEPVAEANILIEESYE